MDRREFLRRSALIAAGIVAADQLELLEKLERIAPRRLFPSAWPNGRVGHIEILDNFGKVARRIPWNGERLIQLPDVATSNARWLRVAVVAPGASPSIAAVRSIGLMEGGSRYTIPWRVNA